MALTKILVGAGGAVAVGALTCENVVVQADLGACWVTDMAIDSLGNVWFTSAPTSGSFIRSTCHKVWMCPAQGECISMQGHNWASPRGIAVDSRNSTTVYISEGGGPGVHPNETNTMGVIKCTLLGGNNLDCVQFGSNWDDPHGLAVDHEGNVLITNAHAIRPSTAAPRKSYGVWTCSPSGQCVLVDGSDRWPASNYDATHVATDTQGNVFVTGSCECTDSNSMPTGFIDECHPFHGACHSYDAPGMSWVQDPGLAVGPEDEVYIVHSRSFMRCSPDGLCEDIDDCDGGPPSRVMAVHGEYLYSVTSDHKPGGLSELQLRRFQIGADTVQV